MLLSYLKDIIIYFDPEIDDFYLGLEYFINRNEPRIPIWVLKSYNSKVSHFCLIRLKKITPFFIPKKLRLNPTKLWIKWPYLG